LTGKQFEFFQGNKTFVYKIFTFLKSLKQEADYTKKQKIIADLVYNI
jgi:hypothetical protein